MDETLTTERLLLRPPHLRDAATLTVLFSDYDVSKMTARIPHPYRLSHAYDFIDDAVRGRADGSAFAFVVARREDGYCLGTAGVAREDAGYHLGYALGKAYWRKGYATESARALCGFAFDRLDETRLSAFYAVENPASGRVLLKLGFVDEGGEDIHSAARGCPVACRRLGLTRDAFAAAML